MSSSIQDLPMAGQGHVLRQVVVGAAVLSLLLSVLKISMDPFVNDDGLLYLESARLIGAGDWSTALSLQNWPFLAACISVLHGYAGLSLVTAGYTLMTALHVLISVSFILLIARFDRRPVLLVCAAVAILVFPKLLEYRSDIIRDPGLWGMLLLGLYFLVGYAQRPSLYRSLGWGVAAIGAFLFRAEGLIFVLLAPLGLLLVPGHPFRTRLGGYLAVQWPLLLVAALLGLWVTFSGQGTELMAGKLKEYSKLLQFFTQEFVRVMELKAEILRSDFFTGESARYSPEYAPQAVVGIILALFLSKLSASVGVVYGGFLAHTLLARLLPAERVAWPIVITGMLVFVLLPLFFLSKWYFLSGRYVMPLTLLLLTLSPFSMARIYENWRHTREPQRAAPRWISLAVAMVLVVLLADGLISLGGSKRYVRDSIDWIVAQIPEDAAFYTDSRPIQFYSGRPHESCVQVFSLEGELRRLPRLIAPDTYVAVKISRKTPHRDQDLETWFGGSPVAVFSNDKGDHVSVWYTGTDARKPSVVQESPSS